MYKDIFNKLLHEDEYDMTDYPGSVSWDNNP